MQHDCLFCCVIDLDEICELIVQENGWGFGEEVAFDGEFGLLLKIWALEGFLLPVEDF